MTGSVSGRGAGAQGPEEAEAGPVATLSSRVRVGASESFGYCFRTYKDELVSRSPRC